MFGVVLITLFLLQIAVVVVLGLKDFLFIYFLIFIIFFYLAALDLSCSMWDLIPWPGIKPRPPTLGASGISHWTTREVPLLIFWIYFFFLFFFFVFSFNVQLFVLFFTLKLLENSLSVFLLIVFFEAFILLCVACIDFLFGQSGFLFS